MDQILWRGGLFGMLALAVCVGPAFAEGDSASSKQTGTDNNDKLARLESLLEAQQLKIQNLEQQVSAARDSGL